MSESRVVNLELIQAIDRLLPQTQCGKCGHPGCEPYAQGIAQGEAINKCPPGGAQTLRALAKLLQRPELPLALPAVAPQRVFIREAECIGCTKCIQACPVDAIVGAAKLMHTVIADECSGCELCIAPCPVDCIDLVPLMGAEAQAQRQRADQFRRRHGARQARLLREEERRQAELNARAKRLAPAAANASEPAGAAAAADDTLERSRRLKIDAAMTRVALNKAEKQLAIHGTEELRRQVIQLREAAEQAQRALEQLQPAQSTAPSPGVADLKRAKIHLASCRAELSKGERQGLDERALASLRQALEQAREDLHAAEAASGKPAPELVRTQKTAMEPRLRDLKTELSYARAELARLQRRQPAETAALEQARQRLASVEQQLHDHQQR